jgi:antitoxin (DNA-binding transcriptional repressor) of toxin-antitoxin stability system
MRVVSPAEAAANLQELLDAAEKGEAVYIQLDEDRKAIRLHLVQRPIRQLDLDAIDAFRATMPYMEKSTAELIEEAREKDVDRF